MEDETYAPWYIVARRLIPYIVVNGLLLPLAVTFIFLGWGRRHAQHFWEATH